MLGRFEIIWKSNIKKQAKCSMTSHLRGLMCFYVLICVSWYYEVLKLVMIMIISSVWKFRKYGIKHPRTSKTRKLALETSVCVSWCFLAGLDVFRVIVLGETDMEGIQYFKVHYYIGNVWVRLPKGLKKRPSIRTQGRSRHCLGSVNWLNQTMPHLLTNGPQMVVSLLYTYTTLV